MTKRILSLILCTATVLSIVPATTRVAHTEGHETPTEIAT